MPIQELVEKIFVVFSLFLSTSALIPVLLNPIDDADALADPLTPALSMGVYAVTSLIVIAHWAFFGRIAGKDLLIWLLVGIALASGFWTLSPDITPRRSVALLGTTVFGAYFGMRYNFREQLKLLAWVFGIVILLSIVFALALPSYGLMTTQESGAHAGAWRGVMTHKNLFGRLMDLSSVVFLFLAISSRRHRWILWVGYSLSVVMVLLSTSKTALVVFLTLMSVLPLYRALRSGYTQIVPLLIAVILVSGGAATIFFENLDVVEGLLGRDLTLTGRTDIWAIVLEMISKRPLLGYGFNGFWNGWNNEASAYVWRTLEWKCPYSHNGFLDLTLELGLSGLAVFLLSFLKTSWQGLAWLRTNRSVEGLWPLMYLTFLVMCNLTEGPLLSSNSVYWTLYVAVVFSIAMEYYQARKNFYMGATPDEEWANVETPNGQF